MKMQNLRRYLTWQKMLITLHFILLVFAISTTPIRTEALATMSCQTGTTLKYTTGDGINIFNGWRCIDNATNKDVANPILTPVNQCPNSTDKQYQSSQGLVCVPANSPSGATQQQNGPTSCAGFDTYLDPICWVRSVVTWGSATLISVAVTIMVAVGWLFNLVISETIVGFNTWIGSPTVLSTIEYGWTFFRDIANILIIGLFVFIAISIILGLKSYGQKSLIARVLIVAILINFSFLFTRVIINASNFLAVNFAQSLGASPPSNAPGWRPPDVAGKFTQLMGVGSWGETKDALAKVAEAQDSGWIALMHGLIVMILAICLALVLLYASFLLIARAVIFIFLLVTSSLAFATYLLPEWASSDFGWKAWWTALFRNAMLAPLMMMFFVVTLEISKGLADSLKASSGTGAPNNPGVGVLGALATDPNNAQNTMALLLYIVILGLLYGSIRISNKFSGAAGQIAWSGTLPFANASVAWPSRSLGFLTRNSVGRLADKASKGFLKQAQTANIRAPGGFGQFAWSKLSQGAKQITKKDFNPGNLTNIKSAQTKLGGLAGQQERRQKAIAERAASVAPSKEAVEAARKQATEQATREITSQKDAARERINAQKAEADIARKQTEKLTDVSNQLQKQIGDLHEKYNAMPGLTKTDRDAKQAVLVEIDSKEGEMNEVKGQIERAKDTAQKHSKEVTDLTQEFDQALQRRIAARTEELMPAGMKENIIGARDHGEIKRDASGLAVVGTKNDIVGGTAVADSLNRLTNVLGKFTGTNKEQNDKFSQEVRKMTDKMAKEKTQKENLKVLSDVLKEEQKHSGQAAKTNEKLDQVKSATNDH